MFFAFLLAQNTVEPGSTSYTSAGAINFTVPNYNQLIIECWGPGGSGEAGNEDLGGNGGGGGGYSKKTYLPGAFTVGSNISGTVGGVGINTTCSTLTANFGTDGVSGGTGGGASGGDINLTGSNGSSFSGSSGGNGGDAAGPGGGTGGTGGSAGVVGNPGNAPGGGGGGGGNNQTGGAGANGQIKFTWS